MTGSVALIAVTVVPASEEPPTCGNVVVADPQYGTWTPSARRQRQVGLLAEASKAVSWLLCRDQSRRRRPARTEYFPICRRTASRSPSCWRGAVPPAGPRRTGGLAHLLRIGNVAHLPGCGGEQQRRHQPGCQRSARPQRARPANAQTHVRPHRVAHRRRHRVRPRSPTTSCHLGSHGARRVI